MIINKEIIINVSIDKIWELLTIPEKIEKWLMPSNLKLEVGNKFHFESKEDENCSDTITNCEILEFEKNKKLVYSWTSDNIKINTKVTFELESLGASTKLTLVHSGWETLPKVDENIFTDHKNGWEKLIGESLVKVANEI